MVFAWRPRRGQVRGTARGGRQGVVPLTSAASHKKATAGFATNRQGPQRTTTCSSSIPPPAPVRSPPTSRWPKPALLYGRAARLQEQPAEQPGISQDQPKGRVPTLVTEHGVLTETPAMLAYIAQTYPQAKLAPLDDAFAFARLQSFNSYLCSTVHVCHAHKMRVARWATQESSFADMKAMIPKTMGACFNLTERDMLRAVGDGRTTPMAMPTFTRSPLARRRRRRHRDLAQVDAHRAAMESRPAVQKVLAERAESVRRRAVAKSDVSSPACAGADVGDGSWASRLPRLQLPSGLQHQAAQPDRARVHLGAGRIEQVLFVDPGIEWRVDRPQRQLP